MWTHVKHTVSRCFGSPRRLRQIRRSVPTLTPQMLVVALVHTVLDYGNGVLVVLPAYLIRQLQSVLNAAARHIYRLRSRDHITDALISLHWLRLPEYKLAVLTYKVLHGGTPSYLGPFVLVADLPGRRVLRSAGFIRPVKLSTVGSRALSVAAPQHWNSLTDDIVLAQLLSALRRQLKHYLFQQSYPDVVL